MEELAECFGIDTLPNSVFLLSFTNYTQISRKRQKTTKRFHNQPMTDCPNRLFMEESGSYAMMKRYTFLTESLSENVVNWYHTYLCHPGETRTEETIKQYLYVPKLQALV